MGFIVALPLAHRNFYLATPSDGGAVQLTACEGEAFPFRKLDDARRMADRLGRDFGGAWGAISSSVALTIRESIEASRAAGRHRADEVRAAFDDEPGA